MTSIRELAELGERIDEDGLAAHEQSLQHLSTLVAGVAPGAGAVLADGSAPAVARQRAVAVATAALLRNAAVDSTTARLAA